MKIKKKLTKIIIFLSFFVVLLVVLASYNKEKIFKVTFNTFFLLPDKIKSSIMIFSGKRSFSNLFNDYNVRFLPNTQFLSLDSFRVKTDIKTSNKVLWDRYNPGGAKRFTYYLEVFEDKIFTISRKGKFYKTEVNSLLNKKKQKSYTELKVNLDLKNILDTLIIDDKIYVSHYVEVENCTFLEVYYANISDDLNFKLFKKFDECGKLGVGSGRMQKYVFNGKEGILLSTASLQQDAADNTPQDDNSIYGKTLFVELKNANYEIFSKGHRNISGLFVRDDLIIATEHGPRGGDEINLIEYKSNYGWPKASYGEGYFKEINYEKSHIDNGFVEPLYAFVPSIGVSEIMITPENFDDKWKNTLIVTSLNGRSIYVIKFQSKKFNKIIYVEKIYIGERIRDIKYVDKIKSFILSLERTADIGVIKKFD